MKIENIINCHIETIDEKAIIDNIIAIIKNEACICSSIYGRALSASFRMLLTEMDNIYDKSHRYSRGEFTVKLKKVYDVLDCHHPIIFDYQIENYDEIIYAIIDEYIYESMDRFINNITIITKEMNMDDIIDEYREMFNPQIEYTSYYGPMSNHFVYDSHGSDERTCNGVLTRRLWERIIR